MSERRRTAGRWATVSGAALLGVTALVAQSGEALDRLTIDDGFLSWDGVRLGMTIPQIERRVGSTVAIRRSKEPGCPVWVAEAEHHGLSLIIGFPSPKPSAKVEWLRVRFEGNLIQASGADLVAALHKKFPEATWQAPKEPAGISEGDDLEPDFAIPGKEPQAVRFYPREAMVLAKSSCLG